MRDVMSTSSKMDHPNFKVQRLVPLDKQPWFEKETSFSVSKDSYSTSIRICYVHVNATRHILYICTYMTLKTIKQVQQALVLRHPFRVMSSKPLKTKKGPVVTQDTSTAGSEMILWSFLSRDWLRKGNQLGVFQRWYHWWFRNPARKPVDMENIPWFTGLYTSKRWLFWDFWTIDSTIDDDGWYEWLLGSQTVDW